MAAAPGAVRLVVVPLLAVPLLAVPLLAVPLLAVPLMAVLLGIGAQPASAGDRPGLDPLIGARIDPGLRLTDASGAPRAFGALLAPGGTLLVLGYHRCRNLCGVLQRQLAETLAELPAAGAPAVLFASLDPTEGPGDAGAMRATLAEAAPAADLSRWRLLTGEAPALAALSAPLGMEAYVRPGGEVIVHPAATAVLTPQGRLSEVFYGFDFTASELAAALDRAADGHVGGLRERIVLLCSGIDAAVGSLARDAWTAIRIAGGATVALLAAWLVCLRRREAR
jgi:protein SCO1/2